MKIQEGIPINCLDLLHAGQDKSKGLSSGKDFSRASVSFENLLENSIKRVDNKEVLPEKLPPFDKDQVARLTGIIRKQMNDALFYAFGDPDNDSSIREFQPVSINLHGPDHLADTDNPVVNQPAPPDKSTAPSREDIEDIIRRISSVHNVDPALTRAVVKAESDFNPGCTSSKGAMGLMQLMPATASELGVRNPYDPAENIDGGTRYLRQLLDRYDGDVDLALSAYNWGMGNVERNPGKLPRETRTYISRVNRYYQEARQEA